MTIHKIAETVVVRNKPHPDHRFDVDGAEFPWYIAKPGAEVTRVSDKLFTVAVEILGISKDDKDYLSIGVQGYNGHELFVGDDEFPWLITDSGIVIRSSRTELLSVKLAFFASKVDSDQYIEDARNVMDIDGSLWATRQDGPQEQPWLDEPRADGEPQDGTC